MYNDSGLLNPFPGLRAFEEDEDILFFGREKQIDELLRKLRTSRFLAIIGSSGSGKSSLVKSGLLPSLHSGLMSGAGSTWRIALFRPGNDPIGNMNEALSRDGVIREGQTAEELSINSSINESILRRSSMGLIEAYKQSGLDKKNNLLVLVDQFEELFRFSKYEKDAGDGKRDSIAFINMLLKAAEQKELPIYVVFTMRSDFLGDCTEFRGLPEAINDGQYLIPRMTREERREAITGPIAVGGATISPALLNRLLNDVGDNPDQLPLLQHALMRTWDEWKKKKNTELPLDIEDYENIGTITEAISQHAEEAYMELSSDNERQTCEKIFKELTEKGDQLSGIRRPRLLSELSAAAGAPKEEVIKIIEIFRKPGRGFLMPAYPAPLTGSSIIDISHESLMRVWKKLIEWLKEEEESAQVYLRLCDAANQKENGKGDYYDGPELLIALNWKAEQNANAAWASRYNTFYDRAMLFLEQSKLQRDLKIKNKEELQKHRLRITRRVTAVVSVIAVLALLLSIFAFQAEVKADKSAKDAETQRGKAEDESAKALLETAKAVNSNKEAVKEKATALLLRDKALFSDSVAKVEKKNADKQTIVAKQETANAQVEKGNALKSAHDAEISKNQADTNAKRAEASALKEKIAKVKEERLRTLSDSRNNAHKAALFVNNKQYKECRDMALDAYKNNLANGGDFQDNDIYTALLLSWEDTISNAHSKILSDPGAPVRSIAGLPGHPDVFFSGDELGRIYTCQYNGGVLTEKPKPANTGNGLRSISVSPDKSYLLAVLLNHTVLFKIGTDFSLKQFATVPLMGIGKHGIFLNGTSFLVQSANGVVKYDISSPPHATDTLKLDNCHAIAIGNGGRIFIAADKKILEYAGWDHIAAPPEKTFSFKSVITSICLDGSGKYLAAGTYDGGIWLKTLGSNDEQDPYPSHHSAVNDIKFCVVAPGRLQLASASSDKTIKLTEVTDEHTLKTDNLITLTEHTSWVYTLFYAPGNNYLFSGSEDHSLKWWPTTMEQLYNNLTKK